VLVELTPAEQAQRDADEQAGAAAQAAQAELADRQAARARRLAEARAALEQGTLFRSLTQGEREIISLLLEAAR
jgi:hypothetical protein